MSRRYAHGSTWFILQLATRLNKIAARRSSSRLATKSQYRRPGAGIFTAHSLALLSIVNSPSSQ